MRIALVSPYFYPDLGYEATSWFRTFLAMGHRVRVFASIYIGLALRRLYEEPYKEGLEQIAGGEILRLPARLWPRDIVQCPALPAAVREFRPDLTLVISPANLFASHLVDAMDTVGGTLICTFEENHAQRRTTLAWPFGPIRGLLLDTGFFLLKRRPVRRCMARSAASLFITPDTFPYVLMRVGARRQRERLREKCYLFPYGFDQAVFYPDPQARAEERRRLGFADGEVIAIYACKITRIKRLDIWVDAVAGAMRCMPRLRAILIGISKGQSESNRVMARVAKTEMNERFICLPFATRTELARLYNAADFGIWHLQPSITLQEAMGTGLYMVLTNEPTMSHVVLDGQTGRYFEAGDFVELEDRIVETADAFAASDVATASADREQRAEVNARRFGYLSLAERLLAAAKDADNAGRHLAFS